MTIKMDIHPMLEIGMRENRTFSVDAETVHEAFEEAGKDYPRLMSVVFCPDGSNREGVYVFLNKHEIRRLDGMNTKLKDGDEILIMQVMAGG